MLHLRRHLVPLLLMLPVIFVCGKLLLTSVNEAEWADSTTGVTTVTYDRGWPWIFVHEADDPIKGMIAGSSTPLIKKFSWLALAGNLAVLGSILFACWWIAVRVHRRPGGWRQFSIRALLGLVAAAAIACGWWMYHVRQAQFEAQLVEQTTSVGVYIMESTAPGWLTRLLPEDWLSPFNRISAPQVPLSSDRPELSDDLLKAIPQFSRVRKLSFTCPLQPNQTIAIPCALRIKDVEPLRQIEEIYFDFLTADDETLLQIVRLPNLKSLEFTGCAITDAGLATLEQGKLLKKLGLSSNGVSTSAGLAHLRQLKHLTELSLLGYDFDDDTFDTLLTLESLEVLHLCAITVSDEALRQSVKLPKLRVLSLESMRTLPSNETIEFLKLHIDEVFY